MLGLEVHPTLIHFLFHLIKGLLFIFLLPCMLFVQNLNVHATMVLLFCSSNMNRRTAMFAYLHVKPMFVFQMLTKQPFNHMSVGASIILHFHLDPSCTQSTSSIAWFGDISTWSLSCETIRALTRTTYKIRLTSDP
jgi:hypothetical protein